MKKLILDLLKTLYTRVFPPNNFLAYDITDAQQASDRIVEILKRKESCMIGRLGSTELACFCNYKSIMQHKHSYKSYIRGECRYWAWNSQIIAQMSEWSGFFPNTELNIIKFCQLFEQDIRCIDLLGSWIAEELNIREELQNVQKTPLRFLEPFYCHTPWTKELKGKKILVVHPFAELIKSQYTKRQYLFNNPDILPEFHLEVVKAIQSLGGMPDVPFLDWFEALNWMKSEIDKKDYDICLIGCGAYGLPLAAHVKRQGKKAVHLGGALQLLFGIKGNRWENPNYGVKEWGIEYGTYSKLMNQYWVKPTEKERIRNAANVENACYW